MISNLTGIEYKQEDYELLKKYYVAKQSIMRRYVGMYNDQRSRARKGDEHAMKFMEYENEYKFVWQSINKYHQILREVHKVLFGMERVIEREIETIKKDVSDLEAQMTEVGFKNTLLEE